MPKGFDTHFYARLLGGFSISFGSRQLTIEANIQTKYMQILLILLQAGEEGIERKQITELLRREDGDRRKQMNNFRQHIHLLRQVIGRSHFPPGKYIVRKGSRYYFNLDYELETDTGYLDQLLLQLRSGPMDSGPDSPQDGENRKRLLWKFCKAYTGEFLPMLVGEEWVIAEEAYYQNWYFNCLNELCGALREEGEFEPMLELCTAASRIHPYDEWQAVQIECLMSMNRYQEAVKLYEDTAQAYYTDLGVSAVDQVMEKYPCRDGYSGYLTGFLSDMKRTLQEEAIQGSYGCSYPSFRDMYRIVSRLEIKSLLLVCTMAVRPGWRAFLERPSAGGASGPLPESFPVFGPEIRFDSVQQEWDRYNPKMELFRQVIADSIRKEDVYTRYSANQFLVLLIGAGEDQGEAITERLKQNWKEICRDGTTDLSFDVQTVEGHEIEVDEDAEERKIHDIYCQPGEWYLAGAGDMAE